MSDLESEAIRQQMQMTPRERIDLVYERSGAGRAEARAALELRGNCIDCAVEYLQRVGLAAVMTEGARYPHWVVCRRAMRWAADATRGPGAR